MRSKAQGWMRALSFVDHVLIAGIVASVGWSQRWTRPLDLLILLLLVPWWHFLHSYFGVYESHRLEGSLRVSARILTATFVGFLSFVPFLWLIGSSSLILLIAKFALAWLIVAISIRVVAYSALRSIRRRGLDRRHVLMIGTWERAKESAARFHRYPEWGLRLTLVGTGNVENRNFVRFPSGEQISTSLDEVLRAEVVDEILIACPPDEIALEQAAIEICRKLGRQCRLQLDSELVRTAKSVEAIDGELTLTVTDAQQHGALGLKRALDLFISSALLLLLSPVLAFIATLVKMSSPGPVLFRQIRVGLNGRRFVMYKFRTMVDGAEAMMQSLAFRNLTGGPTFKDASDLRITPLGRLLRRCSLDELPQLW